MAKFQHPDFGHVVEVFEQNRIDAFEERGYIVLDDEPVKPRTRRGVLKVDEQKSDEKVDEQKSDEKADDEGTDTEK